MLLRADLWIVAIVHARVGQLVQLRVVPVGGGPQSV